MTTFEDILGTNKNIKVLFTGGVLEPQQRHFLELRGYEIIVKPPTLTEAQLIEALNGIQAYIPAGEDVATEKVIQAATDLKIISFFGAGYEKYVNTAAATSAGIAVTNTPGANAQGTAEFVFGLILSMVRHIPYLNETTRRGEWLEERGWNLKNRTIGIIGMGNIGQKVAAIARRGFNMRVIYTSRTRKEQVEEELGVEWAKSLEELLQDADIVTLHPPYDDNTTKGMFGEEQFRLMKPSAILINAARPLLIKEEALGFALENNLIGGVAMDGYYVTPPSVDDPLLSRFSSKKLLVTPHSAYLTDGSVITMTDMVFESIEAFFDGREDIPYLVNPDFRKNARG